MKQVSPEYQREWRLKNLDKARTYRKAYRLANLEKSLAQERAQYQKHKKQILERQAKARPWTKARYGITIKQRDQLFLDQGSLCAICMINATVRWHLDHCHKTNKIRGILCHHCNVLLGFAKDNPAVLLLAGGYIDYHKKEHTT